LETKWTGSILNPDWFTDPNYAPYEDSTNIKFPFWLQPEKNTPGLYGTTKKLLSLKIGMVSWEKFHPTVEIKVKKILK
jgi:hypothetical protein